MNDSNNAYCHSNHTNEQLILVRNPPRERLGVAQDCSSLYMANDALPFYEENIQKRPLTPSHIAHSSHTTTTTPIATAQHRPSSKRSSSFPLSVLQIGLPRFRHSHSQSNDSIESNPTTPTQATMVASFHLTPSLPLSPALPIPPPPSPTSTIIPNINLLPTTNNSAPGKVKSNIRALTTPSTITSSPGSPPNELSRQKTIPIPVPSRQRQNSTSSKPTSPGSSPPPDFLLDDDPFANLTGGSVGFGGGRKPSMISVKADVKTPRSPLVNDDDYDREQYQGRGIGLGVPPLSAPATGRGILATSPRGSLSRTATTTTASRSTPTTPSRNTFSGTEGLGIRSSFPSISFSSSSFRTSGASAVSSGPDISGDSSTLQTPPRSPPQSPPAIHRTFAQPSVTISRPPSFPHPSSSSSQHHVPIPRPSPHRPSPAHQRPAFQSRPSLPSLNTLASMNFAPGAGFVRKVRKGKVGAGLPFEPWNNLDSSGETSPVLTVGEAAGDESGGVGAVPPVPPLPTLASVSRSLSVPGSTESASTPWHGLNQDSRVLMSSPPSGALRYSSSATPSPSSSTSSSSQTYTHTNVHLPPSLSLTLATSPLPSQPIPLGQKPLLPSQILALGPDVRVVYDASDGDQSSGDDRGGIHIELRSPPRSPTQQTLTHAPLVSPPVVPPPSPPQLHISCSSVLEGDKMPDVGTTLNSGSTPPGIVDVFHGLDANTSVGTAKHDNPNPVMAPPRHDDVFVEGAAEVHGHGDGDGVDGDDDVGGDVDGDMDDGDEDVDRFMDQFMDHYDRDEDQRGRLDLMEHEEVGRNEDNEVVEKGLVKGEDEMGILVQPPPRPPQQRSPVATTSFSEMAHDISVSSSAAAITFADYFPNSIAVDTSCAILAPTLRTRTRRKKTINTPIINIDMDRQGDDNSSFFESYLYTYPYPSPPPEVELLLLEKKSSTLSMSSLTPPVSARGSTWSPSESVSPGSRSRSLSSSLSFESERSSLDRGDDEEQQQQQQHILSSKSSQEATDTILHAEVSVFGSPALSIAMPSGVNVSAPCLGSISPVHLGPLLSSHTHHEEPSAGDDDDDDNTKNDDSVTSLTVYFNDDKDDSDVNISDDKAGEATGEGFNSRPRSQHRVVSKLWVGEDVSAAAVVMSQSEGENEGEKDVPGGQEGEKQDLVAEMKTETEVEEDVEAEVGQEFEWDYVIGGGSFVGGNNGSSGLEVAFGHEREREKKHTIDTVTPPPGFSEPVDDINLVTRHSPHTSTATSLATPAIMTQQQFISPSDGLLKDDNLACGSSTTLAAAFAMFSWKQDTSELVEGVEGSSAARGGNGNGSYSSTHKSGGSASHATYSSNLNSSPFDWNGRNGRREGGNGNDDDDDDDDDDEKRRRRRAALERGGRMDESSLMAISSESSSSSGDDDDHYGPITPLPSKLVTDENLRTHHSRTHSTKTTPPPSAGYLSASVACGHRGSGTSSSSSSDEDDYDDCEDDQQQANNPHHSDDDDDDDDIPLAKRIPGALTAQKSIRHQVRREREQKKQEKALQSQGETTRTRLMTLRPAGAVPSSLHDAAMSATAVPSSSQASTHHQYLQEQQQRRQRSQTLTGKGSMSGNPFSPEDLARKLKDINGQNGSAEFASSSSYQQQQARLPSRQRSKSVSRSSWDFQPASVTEVLPPVPISHVSPNASHAQRTKSMKEPSSSYRYHPSSPSPSPIIPAHGPSSPMALRPKRSFHRSSTEHRPVGMGDPRSVPLPLDAEPRVSRSSTSVTRSRPPTRDGPQQSSILSPISTSPHRSLSQSRDRSSPMMIPEPIPPIPAARISQDEQRKLLRHYESPLSRVGSSRTSVDTEKPPKTSSHQHRPVPVPALPPTTSAVDPLLVPMITGKPEAIAQQRVFVGDMQRFKMVEIGTSTTAGDIVEMIESDGSLMGFAGSGGWMVFEVAQDFGMERPIRSFELVTDVQASWNKDKMVNYLVLRLTLLAAPLNRSAIPSRSPTHSGYVEWEAKRGKWSKRWMQLREHSIWLSKRDNGRDEVQLCSLSNFDAYQVTRSHRAPKPFAFAVKSTDNLTFFENTADYLHSFACSEKDGKVWMEKILVARSYVLFQERHVLFNPKAVGNPSGLSRAGTRKATNQRPTAQPLLAIPPFSGVSQSTPHHDVFEPGSLLSKQL